MKLQFCVLLYYIFSKKTPLFKIPGKKNTCLYYVCVYMKTKYVNLVFFLSSSEGLVMEF